MKIVNPTAASHRIVDGINFLKGFYKLSRLQNQVLLGKLNPEHIHLKVLKPDTPTFHIFKAGTSSLVDLNLGSPDQHKSRRKSQWTVEDLAKETQRDQKMHKQAPLPPMLPTLCDGDNPWAQHGPPKQPKVFRKPSNSHHGKNCIAAGASSRGGALFSISEQPAATPTSPKRGRSSSPRTRSRSPSPTHQLGRGGGGGGDHSQSRSPSPGNAFMLSRSLSGSPVTTPRTPRAILEVSNRCNAPPEISISFVAKPNSARPFSAPATLTYPFSDKRPISARKLSESGEEDPNAPPRLHASAILGDSVVENVDYKVPSGTLNLAAKLYGDKLTRTSLPATFSPVGLARQFERKGELDDVKKNLFDKFRRSKDANSHRSNSSNA
jgi:hypothetical protein